MLEGVKEEFKKLLEKSNRFMLVNGLFLERQANLEKNTLDDRLLVSKRKYLLR
jgi:hypothetical protein